MVDHRSVCNLYLMADTYGIREGTRVLQLASYSFDASVGDIFHTLLSGATLYLSTREQLSSGREFVDWLRSNRIETIPFIPPSVLKTLPLEDLPDLHTISPSGESLPLDLIGTWGRERTFINAYGPTETVVDATVHICEPQMDKSIIGKPIPNKKVYVVNENGQLQPVGVPGELWIGGIGVARGYLNRPELTRERFVTAPFAPGERLYRSGDLVRWLPDGSLEYKGRMDDQVKIRGHRIELGEIEARLLQHPAVREAVVVSRQDDEGMAYLAAYFTSDSQWTSEELRVFLARELPEYMLPSRFMELMDLPLNPNGKVDKHALPEPPVPETGTANYIPPRNEMEQLLADIWQDVLRIEKVGIRDNFFELGGDSIKAIQIAARLHEQQLRFEMKDLFRHPTIAELAPLTRRLEVKREQGPMEGEVPLTPIQHWFFEQPLEAPHHYNQSMMLYRAEGWDPSRVEAAFERLVEHHDALRMIYELEGERVRQRCRGLEEGPFFTLDCVDVRGEVDPAGRIEETAEGLQAGLDLEKGPLVRLGLFATDEGDHLLIVIHHLVVDGVSWRILLEDLETLYRGGVLPEKTSSYREWAEGLIRYGESREAAKEEVYWQEIEQQEIPSLPRDRESREVHRFGNSRTEVVTLDEATTSQLLTEAHQAYRTEINDLLLAALSLAIREWSGADQVAIHLEGHGREEILPEVDLTRTVGWFTSIYPVVLPVRTEDPGTVIKEVKETLRRVPHKGVGYGVRRYLQGKRGKVQPRIGFNYLGSFEQEAESGMPVGTMIASGNVLEEDLDLTAVVVKNQLHLRIAYHSHLFHAATIQRLASGMVRHLLRLTKHCLAKDRSEYTPSDFSEKDLTLDELEDVFEIFEGKK